MNSKPATNPIQTEVIVTNPDEPGMGHGMMGWRVDNPGKFFSGPAERNKGSISGVLVRVLGELTEGLALEVGSGSGQHVSHFASLLPNVNFQPTEYPGQPNPRAEVQDIGRMLSSIKEHCKELQNVLEPAQLDAAQLSRSAVVADGTLDALIAINVIHLSPELVLDGIINGAGVKLKQGGVILFYGPFSRNGVIAGEGNKKFQATLQSINPAYGLRDIVEIKHKAEVVSIDLAEEVFFEDSNNYVLVLRKR